MSSRIIACRPAFPHHAGSVCPRFESARISSLKIETNVMTNVSPCAPFPCYTALYDTPVFCSRAALACALANMAARASLNPLPCFPRLWQTWRRHTPLPLLPPPPSPPLLPLQQSQWRWRKKSKPHHRRHRRRRQPAVAAHQFCRCRACGNDKITLPIITIAINRNL